MLRQNFNENEIFMNATTEEDLLIKNSKDLLAENSKEVLIEMILRERLKYNEDMMRWINKKKEILRKVQILYASLKES